MAALSLVVDNFDDNSLSTLIWDLFGNTPAIFSEANQRAQFAPPDSLSQSARLESVATGDLTGDKIYCRMTGFRDGASSAETIFAAHTADAANQLQWVLINGSMLAKKVVGGTATTLLSTPWYPDLHAWFRLRESAGTTFWDTAPITASNPPVEGDWVNRHSEANPIVVTALKIRLHGGTFNTSSVNCGIGIFDGVNTACTVEAGTSSVTYVDIGAVAFGTTSAAPPFPAGAIAGDKALLIVASKYALPATPAGWTLEASHVGGSGAAGVDAGNPYQSIFSKTADGTETTATTVTVSQTGDATSAMAASVALIRKPANTYWQFTSSKGADTTGGGNWSVTGDVNLATRRHDLTLVASAINGDISTADAQQLAISGVAHGSVIEIRDSGTANGDDIRSVATLHYVTSGEATALPTYTFTSTNNTVATTPAGPSIVFNIRALPKKDYVMPAATGGYSTTGNAAGLRAARRMPGDTASYALIGQNAALRAARRLVADSGALAITGNAAALRIARQLTIATGAYTLTGNAAALALTLKGASATQSAQAGAGSISQVHALTVPQASQTSTSGSGAASQIHVLTVPLATQPSTSSSAAITMTVELFADSSKQANTSTGGAVVDAGLRAENAVQDAVSQAGGITLIVALAGANSIHTPTATAGMLFAKFIADLKRTHLIPGEVRLHTVTAETRSMVN